MRFYEICPQKEIHFRLLSVIILQSINQHKKEKTDSPVGLMYFF